MIKYNYYLILKYKEDLKVSRQFKRKVEGDRGLNYQFDKL